MLQGAIIMDITVMGVMAIDEGIIIVSPEGGGDMVVGVGREKGVIEGEWDHPPGCNLTIQVRAL